METPVHTEFQGTEPQEGLPPIRQCNSASSAHRATMTVGTRRSISKRGNPCPKPPSGWLCFGIGKTSPVRVAAYTWATRCGAFTPTAAAGS